MSNPVDFSDYVKKLESLIDSPSAAVSTPESAIVSHPESIPITQSSHPQKSSTKLKLLIVSQHISQTSGSGKMSKWLIRELSKTDWLNIVHFATHKCGTAASDRTYPPSVKVYDISEMDKKPDKPGQSLGLNELPNVIRKEKPHVILFYGDMINITRYTECVRQANLDRTFRIWMFIDQNHMYLPPPAVDIINRESDTVFTYSQEWKTHMKAQGIIRNIGIIAPIFDQTTCRLIPKEVARQSASLPADVTIFLSTHRNQPRKRLDITIMAFVELIVKYPAKNIFLLCVCDKGEQGGHSLFEIFSNELRRRTASQEYFGNRLLITSSPTTYSYKDDDMNIFYNLADVGVNCSDGDGYNLCAFEQMGLGIPQIVSDIAGHRDFCTSSNSLIVKPSLQCYVPGVLSALGGEMQMVKSSDVTKAMEAYIMEDDLRKTHGTKARESVLKYTCEKSMASIIKYLESQYKDLNIE